MHGSGVAAKSEASEAKSESQRPITAPAGFPISVCGIIREEQARRFGEVVGAYIYELSRHIDLSGLDGVTIAAQYEEALSSLDRGYRTSHELTPSTGEAVGVAMTPAVKRNGAIKNHMVFNIEYLLPLGFETGDLDLFAGALHTLAHECAHVEVTRRFDEAFPGVLLDRAHDNVHEAFRWQVILACWDEFAASWIAAPFGAAPTDNYEEVFLRALRTTRETAYDFIKAYRLHGDVDQVLAEVYGVYGSLMKYAAYLLGDMETRGLSIDDMPKTKAALSDSWFAPFFERLCDALKVIAANYGHWENERDFEEVGDLADAVVEAGGIQIKRLGDESIRADIPFTPETIPTPEEQKTLFQQAVRGRLGLR